MTKLFTTCQICARAIKSKSGTIAHHGYKRPHQQGWQTASCMGTHYRPFEVACDALPPAIESCKRYIERTSEYLLDLLANPPATIEYQRKNAYGMPDAPLRTFTKPEEFDPHNNVGCYNPSRDGYQMHFNNRRNKARQEIKGSQETMKYLQDRLASWKAPAETTEKVEA